jgi:wobble nucleotide-excising tRNase
VGHIEPFAIIGAKNIEIENQIIEKEDLLGSEEKQNGIRYKFKLKNEEYEKNRKEKNNLQNGLDDKLRDKANNDIKRNSKIYNNVTYNIVSIKRDIGFINKNPRSLLEEKQVSSVKELLQEEPKSRIPPLTVFYSTFKTLMETSKNLLDKVIRPSIPIQELLNNAVLEMWVRSGIEHHREKRETCGFCGQKLPDGLWLKLDAHFSKESEELRDAITNHIVCIEQEKQKIKNLSLLKKDQFYSTLKTKFENKEEEWKEGVNNYCRNLDKLINELNARLKDIFKARILGEIEDYSEIIEGLQNNINALINQNNSKTDTLKKDQEMARTDLRLNEVGGFIKAIGYTEKVTEIEKLTTEESNLLELKNGLSESIINIEKDIEQLKIELKDEKKGADKVNEYLNHYFGHDGLRLVAQEEGSGYKFNIQRGFEIAHNLSEGERSLVAFCYFMARLEDTESEGKELIIWIDDPVSSLDSNHVFFVFSLIENIIVKPHKYKQLFISTHNLDFLKYLRRLTKTKKETEYFIVEGSKKNSRLIIMPDYLRRYITETIVAFAPLDMV